MSSANDQAAQEDQQNQISEKQHVEALLDDMITTTQNHLSKTDRITNLLKIRLNCMQNVIESFDMFLPDDHQVRKKVRYCQSMLEDFDKITESTKTHETILHQIKKQIKDETNQIG